MQKSSSSTVSKKPPPVPTKPPPEARTTTSSAPKTDPKLAYSHSMSLPRGTNKKPKPPPPLPKSQSQEQIHAHASPVVSTTQSSDASGKQPGQKHTGSYKEVLSVGMSLQQLVAEYGDKVPIQIRVLKGYCGNTPRTTISRGDTYNVHFVKCTQVVTVRNASRDQYSIPINSAIKFGMIYDPENNRKKAMQGYTFHRVADITALHQLPKVISLEREVSNEGEDSEESITDVLIVKGIQKFKVSGKKCLSVFNLEAKTEEILPDSYCRSFSTKPSSIMIHLPDIIEHVVNPFPGDAIMEIDYALACQSAGDLEMADLPDSLFSKAVKIYGCCTETTLVSSMVVETDPARSDTGVLIDIPITEEELCDIEVAVVHIRDDDEIQRLNDCTRSMLETFNPMKIMSCKDAISEVSYATQSLLYHAIRPGCEKLGVEILEPSSSIYDVPTAALERIRKQYGEQIVHQKIFHQQSEDANMQSKHGPQLTGRDRPRLPTPDETSDYYETAVSSQNSPLISAEAVPSHRNTAISLPPVGDYEPDSDYDTVVNSLTYARKVTEETPIRGGDSENKLLAAPDSEQIYDTPTHSYLPVADSMISSSVSPNQICELQEAIKQLKKDMVEMSGQIRAKLQAVDDLVSGHQELASQVKTLEAQFQRLAQPDHPRSSMELPTLKTEEANRKALCSMNAIEVRQRSCMLYLPFTHP